MKKNLMTLMALSIAFVCWGAIPSGYYSAMEGKKKADLMADAKSSARKHTVISYGDDTWEAFRKTDTRMVGGNLCWWDMYSNNNVKVSNGHPGMNIEHSVANSWWGGTKNDAYKDLFHLNPSDATANNRKSNFPLGIVEDSSWSNGITTVGHPKSGTCYGATNVYEPADQYKGDFARVFFYMFTVYDDISWDNRSDRNFMYDGSSYPSLRPWAYTMLLEWAKNDPVDEKEIARNEAIYGIQHNRNPFIDFPELAEYIWGSKTDVAFYASQQGENPDPGPGPDPDPDPDPEPGPGPGVEGEWSRVTGTGMLAEGFDYIVVSVKDNVPMGYTLVNDKAISRAEDAVEVSAAGVISTIGSDVAIVRLESVGGGWQMHVYDGNGDSHGYLTSTTAKTTTLESTGTTVTITPGSEETKLSFGGAGTLQYNASSPRFTTYTSNQQSVFLYRKVETTGIDVIEEVIVDEAWFDLTGRRVNPENLSPGLYIHAGKKILVR